MSDIEDLHKLADLKERGVISQKEFDKKKADILNGRSRIEPPTGVLNPKRRGLWWKIPLGILVLIFIGNIINKDKDTSTNSNSSPQISYSSNNSSSNSSAAPNPQPSPSERMRAIMPREQNALLAAVAAARRQYAAGANDMAKGAARPARARALCAALPGRAVNSWVGQVNSLSTNGEGKGVLTLEIGPDTYVKTWNNSLSDIGDKTLIEPSSSLFATATRLREGQLVRFSGNFFNSQTDCIEESSMSLSGSIDSPEFIFSFQSLSPLN